MNCIAIIPSRSGSKGLKDKNIKILNGKPLLSYSIDAALKSKIFDEVMVSTDSERYAKIAKKYGASVPFLRSRMNSSDKASTHDVIVEVISNYKKLGKNFNSFCILQPTSPLRTYKDIIGAYKLFIDKARVAVVSVCEVDHSPTWCNVLPTNLSLYNFIHTNDKRTRRQDLDIYHRINGAIYFCYVDEYLKNSNFYRQGSYAYIMNKKHSIDIDTIDDFNYAKFILSKK